MVYSFNKKEGILIYWNPLKILGAIKKMKESLFNYRFEYENQKYIFNTNNNGLIQINNDIFTEEEREYLRVNRFWVDDNEDEIGIETIQLMLALKFIAIDHMAETVTAVVLDEDNEEGKKRALAEAEKLINEAITPGNENKKSCEIKNHHDGVIIKKSDTLEQYSEKVNKIKATNKSYHDFSEVSGAILYLDPPYEGTRHDSYINSFDSQEFYDWAFEMAKTNIVIISSYSISDERFEVVYSFDKAHSNFQGGTRNDK